VYKIVVYNAKLTRYHLAFFQSTSLQYHLQITGFFIPALPKNRLNKQR